MKATWLVMLATALAGACTGSTEPEVASREASTGVIDSILPMAEYERRFRGNLTEVTELSGGEATPKRLAEKVLAAIAEHDTAALAELSLSRAEFAWLVFPEHLYRNPPYELDPALFWLQIQQGSSKGAGKLLQRFGGTSPALHDVNCQPDTLQIKRPARIRLLSCTVRIGENDKLLEGRLFGSVVELDGRLKLLSYANDL